MSTGKEMHAAGLTSEPAFSQAINGVNDSPPAAPSTPDLIAASDSGSSESDNLTNDTTPTFSGTAEASSTVELFADGSSLGSTTADSNGNWNFTVSETNALTDGSYSITVTASKASGGSIARIETTPIPAARYFCTNQEYINGRAFAALKDDGSVVTWGYYEHGGDSSSVSDQLSSGVTQIFSTGSAFAALKDDGSVITWGGDDDGGDSSSVSAQLSSGVVAFADPFHDDRLIPGTSGAVLTSDPSNALTITIDTSDLNGDGFVDAVTNYQMWTALGGVDLKNHRGRTYSEDTSRKWDATKAVETNSGFSILIEGQRNKEGKCKVVSANEEGVIGRSTRWLNGNQMFNEGYEDLFAMDFNGNSEIGF